MNDKQHIQAVNMLFQALYAATKKVEEDLNNIGKETKDAVNNTNVAAFTAYLKLRKDGNEEKADKKETDKSLTPITKDNVAFYACQSQTSAVEAAKFLQANDIPALVMHTEFNHERGAIMIVPKQYESEADRFIGNANKVFTKTEIDRNSFFAIHNGEKIVEFKGIEENQLKMIRDRIYDKPAEYCVSKQSDGKYKIASTPEDRSKIAAAVYESYLNLNGKQGSEYKAWCEARNETEKKLVSIVTSPKNNKDAVLIDYANPNVESYRIQKDRMIHYVEGKEPEIILKKDAQEYAAQIIAASQRFKAPVIGEMDEKTKIHDKPRMEDVCSRQEIAAGAKEMSRTDTLNGHSSSDVMASKIVSLMVSAESNNDLDKVRDAINSSLKLSELAVWAEQAERSRYGVAEILHNICDNTSLDVTVIEEVLQFAKDDINNIIEARSRGELTETERESDMTDLGVNTIVNEIIPTIETVDEYVEDYDKSDKSYTEYDAPDEPNVPTAYDEQDVPDEPDFGFSEIMPDITGDRG